MCRCLVIDNKTNRQRQCGRKDKGEFCAIHRDGKCKTPMKEKQQVQAYEPDDRRDDVTIVSTVKKASDVRNPKDYRTAQINLLQTFFYGRNPKYPDYNNYNNKYNRTLADKVIETLHGFQDDACLRGQKNPDTLAGMICKTTLLYHPIPITADELKTNGDIVNLGNVKGSGVNGRIVLHPFDGKNVIIKINLHEYDQSHEEMMKELYINFVVINRFLITYPELPFLVATYGFYICDKDVTDPDHPIVCDGANLDGQPSIMMIQQAVEGRPLREEVENGRITLSHLKRIIVQTLVCLSLLQDSTHHLTHFDLHSDNIMIDSAGNVKIIDWGMSSLTVDGIRYTNFLEEEYHEHGDSPIISGAYDVFFLLKSLYLASQDAGIKAWITSTLDNLFFRNTFYYEIDKPITKQQLRDDYYLLRGLLRLENNNMDIHRYNHAKLNKMTYRYLCNRLIRFDTADQELTIFLLTIRPSIRDDDFILDRDDIAPRRAGAAGAGAAAAFKGMKQCSCNRKNNNRKTKQSTKRKSHGKK